MIIEDSILLIERFLMVIEETGIVKGAEYALNYHEAQLSFSKITPDILVLDINLPDVNGIEMLKIFRKNYPSLKIIISSIHTDDYYRVVCRNLGADYFVSKTDAFEALPSIIYEIAAAEAVPA